MKKNGTRDAMSDEARQRAIARAQQGPQRAAQSSGCRLCGRPVMVGLDDDSCALTAVVDPYPLSPAGEVVALMQGRKTYTLAWAGGRYEIDRRDEWRIEGNPPGSRPTVDVVVNHECGTQPFQRLSTLERGKRREQPIDPPF